VTDEDQVALLLRMSSSTMEVVKAEALRFD
jgi:hypothetical protein